MSNQNVIRRIADVREVAIKMFPCSVVRIDETHSKGYMGVKIITGFKINPIFDPNANPERPELSSSERILERRKAEPRVADVRIIWLRPGITVTELIDEHLNGIKQSLDKRSQYVETSKKVEPKHGPSDDELAAMVDKGDTKKAIVADEIDEEFESEDNEFELEDEYEGDKQRGEGPFNPEEDETQEFEEDEDGDIVGVKEKSRDEVAPAPKDEVMGVLSQLANAVGQLNDNMGAINSRLNKLEKSKSSKKKK